MQSGLYVALSGQVALERRLQTIAANVANMNTIGYRADGVSFEAQMAKAGDSVVAFASGGADFISRQTGGMSKTGNPLDVAVQGDAWLAIKTPAGTVYTRDGRMTISETGELTTLNGYSVLDAGGAPILLDATAGPPDISRDGMITQNHAQVGALGLYSIDDNAKLVATPIRGHSGQAGHRGARLHCERRRPGFRRKLERQSDHGDDQTDCVVARLRRRLRRD